MKAARDPLGPLDYVGLAGTVLACVALIAWSTVAAPMMRALFEEAGAPIPRPTALALSPWFGSACAAATVGCTGLALLIRRQGSRFIACVIAFHISIAGLLFAAFAIVLPVLGAR